VDEVEAPNPQNYTIRPPEHFLSAVI